MALKQINLTLLATPTPLTSLHANRKGIRQAFIHNTTGNSPIYVGHSGTSATDYGYTVAAGSTLEIGPFSGDAPTNTSDVYIFGTVNDVVHILLVTH
jgi:hypothetical protein